MPESHSGDDQLIEYWIHLVSFARVNHASLHWLQIRNYFGSSVLCNNAEPKTIKKIAINSSFDIEHSECSYIFAGNWRCQKATGIICNQRMFAWLGKLFVLTFYAVQMVLDVRDWEYSCISTAYLLDPFKFKVKMRQSQTCYFQLP